MGRRPKSASGTTSVDARNMVNKASRMCIFTVNNEDPNMYYAWLNKDNPLEMQSRMMLGYRPAIGKEQPVMQSFGQEPFQEGQPKIIGNRILMCCPRDQVQARRVATAKRYEKPEDDGERTARAMRAAAERKGGGVGIENLSETELE